MQKMKRKIMTEPNEKGKKRQKKCIAGNRGKLSSTNRQWDDKRSLVLEMPEKKRRLGLSIF